MAFSLSIFHAAYLNHCQSHLFLIRRQDFSHVSWHHWFNRVMRLPVLFWKSNRSASCYFCTELLQLDLAVKFMWEQTEWMENRRHGRCCMWMCWFWMSLIQSQFLKAALSSAPLSEFFNRFSEHMAWLRWLKIMFRVGICPWNFPNVSERSQNETRSQQTFPSIQAIAICLLTSHPLFPSMYMYIGISITFPLEAGFASWPDATTSYNE